MLLLNYHEAFFTPGISPRVANSLKQIRHKPKSLIYPWRRPQRKHRLTIRVENFGFFFALAITDVFAMVSAVSSVKYQVSSIGCGAS